MTRGTKKLVSVSESKKFVNGEFSGNEVDMSSYQVTVEPNYVKIYLDNVLMLKNIPNTRNPILYEFLKSMTYADQKQLIFINSYVKKQVSSNIGISVKYIEKAITEFVKANILIRLAQGTYQVNPMIFGKGDWSDIKKLRIEMSYMNNSTGDKEIISFENILDESNKEAAAAHEEMAITKEVVNG